MLKSLRRYWNERWWRALKRHLNGYGALVLARRNETAKLVLILGLLAFSDAGVAMASEGQASGSIVGRVVDENGAVVAGIEVELYVDGEGPVRRVVTGSTGNFTFAEVPSGGPHWLLVECESSYGLSTTSFDVLAGEATQVEMKVRRAPEKSEQGGDSDQVPHDPEKTLRKHQPINWLMPIGIALAFVGGLCLLLFRFRDRFVQGTLFGSATRVALVLVAVPWGILFLSLLIASLAPTSRLSIMVLVLFN